MRQAKLDHYSKLLLDLRDRLTGNVNHVVEAIQEDISPAGNLSGTPLHLADVASEGIDADVHVLEAERGILDDIRRALARIDEGSFGLCEECGEEISAQRLEAIPYTPRCIECARAADQATGYAAWD